jgi:hypothetical protein
MIQVPATNKGAEPYLTSVRNNARNRKYAAGFPPSFCLK